MFGACIASPLPARSDFGCTKVAWSRLKNRNPATTFCRAPGSFVKAIWRNPQLPLFESFCLSSRLKSRFGASFSPDSVRVPDSLVCQLNQFTSLRAQITPDHSSIPAYENGMSGSIASPRMLLALASPVGTTSTDETGDSQLLGMRASWYQALVAATFPSGLLRSATAGHVWHSDLSWGTLSDGRCRKAGLIPL